MSIRYFQLKKSTTTLCSADTCQTFPSPNWFLRAFVPNSPQPKSLRCYLFRCQMWADFFWGGGVTKGWNFQSPNWCCRAWVHHDSGEVTWVWNFQSPNWCSRAQVHFYTWGFHTIRPDFFSKLHLFQVKDTAQGAHLIKLCLNLASELLNEP